ncbi:MAG: DUF4430 domain-containing protein [Lacipirellulaceae bacterium]
MSERENSPPEPHAAASEIDSPDDHGLIGKNDGPWWMYPLVLVGALAIVGLLAERANRPPMPEGTSLAEWTPLEPADNKPVAETVKLTIDFGNGATRSFEKLPWNEGMTVADLMQAAKEFRPGIRYEAKGEGKTAFLDSLEGVAGGGVNERNWLYRVNGEHAKKSYGVFELQPGDEVLWIYERGEGE